MQHHENDQIHREKSRLGALLHQQPQLLEYLPLELGEHVFVSYRIELGRDHPRYEVSSPFEGRGIRGSLQGFMTVGDVRCPDGEPFLER